MRSLQSFQGCRVDYQEIVRGCLLQGLCPLPELRTIYRATRLPTQRRRSISECLSGQKTSYSTCSNGLKEGILPMLDVVETLEEYFGHR